MGRPFPGRWSLRRHPWLLQLLDDDSANVVIRKGSQLGLTEYALNRCLWGIDVHKWDALYVLPQLSPDATDFTASRFDPAIELSEHIEKLFTNVDNIGHKRAGASNLYVRGSNSRSGLKSVPVARLVFDELDEMVQGNIDLAVERVSGQPRKQIIRLSTPTVEGHGIDLAWGESTQQVWMFACPRCGRRIELTWPEAFRYEEPEPDDFTGSAVVCPLCKGDLPTDLKLQAQRETGEWVAARPQATAVGYHINQLYSSTVSAAEIAAAWKAAQVRATKEQEFFNHKLGLAHSPKGARISDGMISSCVQAGRHMLDSSSGATMGLDVGKLLHYEIDEWREGRKWLVAAGTCVDFKEIARLLRQYRVYSCVVDALPEERSARALQQAFPHLVVLAFYKDLKVPLRYNEPQQTVDINRTEALDATLGRIRNGTHVLPMDLPEEWRAHVKAPVRVLKEDPRTGNPKARYMEGALSDHFAHAAVYSEVAHVLRPEASVWQGQEGLPFGVNFLDALEG